MMQTFELKHKDILDKIRKSAGEGTDVLHAEQDGN